MVSLRIDNRNALVENTEPGHLGVLDVDSPLFVGGMRNDVLEEARRMWHIRNSTSFFGKRKLSVKIFNALVIYLKFMIIKTFKLSKCNN